MRDADGLEPRVQLANAILEPHIVRRAVGQPAPARGVLDDRVGLLARKVQARELPVELAADLGGRETVAEQEAHRGHQLLARQPGPGFVILGLLGALASLSHAPSSRGHSSWRSAVPRRQLRGK